MLRPFTQSSILRKLLTSTILLSCLLAAAAVHFSPSAQSAAAVAFSRLAGSNAPQQNPASDGSAFCFADEKLNESLRDNPELRKTLDAQEQTIRNYVENFRSNQNYLKSSTTTSTYVIPVVVYVVHDGGASNISEQQINSQLAALNVVFNAYGIKFCLATKQNGVQLPGSPTPGIIRINNTALANHDVSAEEAALKGVAPVMPGDRYLRIWVVKDIDNGSGVAGYARFPGTVSTSLEGIVIRHDVFGEIFGCGGCSLLPSYNQGDILAHEVGHYLNLFHTFQGGCTGVTASDCAAFGDKVCDTPQIAAAGNGCPPFNSVISCDGSPALLDNQMDYTNDICRANFTPGQETRMIATLSALRTTLVSPQNLVYTGVQCVSGLNAGFAASNYNPCKNDAVTFTAVSSSGVTYAWDFGDGQTASVNPASHTYATPGAYSVTLTVTSGGNSVSSTQQIFVGACTPLNSPQGNWYFGRLAGLTFSSGSPLPALGAFLNNTVNTVEGSVSQSDPLGNLLFYSDGIKVWDKNHALVNPATPLTGDSSTTQSALSFPVPGNANRYYLFTIPSRETYPSGKFAYSILDATGGNASLVTANTLVALPTGATSISEAVTAVQKCNGDYWVIVRGYLNDPSPLRNSFYVYSVTASGVTLAGTYPFANRSFIGQLKMSPDGTLLASSGGYNENSAVICDFDRGSGVLSNPKSINKGNYGITFSPNSHVFYIVARSSSNDQCCQVLYQYDLLNPNPAATERIVATTPDVESSLQIGPDQKVYMSLYTKKHLAVINFPNNLVSTGDPNACGYSYNGPSLVTSSSQGISSQLGLPNMIDALPVAQIPADFTFAVSSCSTLNFNFKAPTCATTSYAWNFGDSTTSTVQNPTHTYALNGTYTVTLTLNGTTTVTHTVTIGLPASAATIYGPSGVCLASGGQQIYNYSANAQPGLTYSWSVSGGAISGPNNNDNIDVVWNTLPGTVQLTVNDPATGCSVTKTLTVIVNCNPNQCVTPPPSLTNWWRFDETSGTTAQDSSGFVNNAGTHINGPTPVAGVVNGALAFDGVNDYVEVADQQELNFLYGCITDFAETMTIDMWVKTSLPPGQMGASSGLLTLLDKRVNTSQPNGYHLFLYEGRFGFQMSGANYVAPDAGANYIDIADNQWHFVAVSLPMCRGVGGGFLYVDGKRVMTLPRGSGFENTAKLNIGRRDPAFGVNYFRGALDELEIFKSALTEDELRVIYEARSRGKCKNSDVTGLQYYPLPSPVRLLDTRPNPFTSCIAASTPLGSGSTTTLGAISACTGVPANAKAIVGNATVVSSQGSGGYITLYPNGASLPNASNLNYSPGQVVPNAFTVGLDGGGNFNAYASGATDFIVDVTGYYAPPGAGGLYFHPLAAPVRLLDTRPNPFTSCIAASTPLGNGSTTTLSALGACTGIPATAKAVVGNATVVNFQSGGGYLTLFPSGSPPNASNLNYTANQVVPNAFTVGLDAGGNFKVFASGATDLIVDVSGYYDDQATGGLLFYPLSSPGRWLDTRPDPFVSCVARATPLGNGETFTLQAELTCGGLTIPAAAQAVLGNATVVNFQSGGGYITLWPTGAAQPNASNLNYGPNQVVPNAFVVGLSAGGAFNLFASGATDFIVDLSGYFAP